MGGEKQARGKVSAKKIFGVALNILLYLFMAACLAAVIFTIFAKRDRDGAVSLFGYEMRIVVSGSMEKNAETDVSGFRIKDIPVRSMVITESVPESEEKAPAWYGKLKAGDVLTFRYDVAGRQETITHRIISIEPAGKGYKIVLKGDNSDGEQTIYTYDDASPNYVLGKVVHVSVVLGYAIWILQQPVGMALVVIVPAAIVIVIQLIRIVNVLGEEKRKKLEAREAEKSSEIELLKQRLADLESQRPAEPAAEAELLSETAYAGAMSEESLHEPPAQPLSPPPAEVQEEAEELTQELWEGEEDSMPQEAANQSGPDGDFPAIESEKEE